MKNEYGLDNHYRGWFNECAQKSWNTWKSKVLKKYYDHFKTHAVARLAHPVHLWINMVNWLKLTDEFQRVNTVRHDKCGLCYYADKETTDNDEPGFTKGSYENGQQVYEYIPR